MTTPYREIRKPALSVLDENPGSNTRRTIQHGSVQGALHNRSIFWRLQPIFGWRVRERRTLIGLLTGAPRSDRDDFEPDNA